MPGKDLTALTKTDVIAGNGVDVSKLPKRQAKRVAIQTLITINHEMTNHSQRDAEIKEDLATIRKKLKNTSLGQKVDQLTKERRDSQEAFSELCGERNGILRLMKEMGIDVTKEVSKIKQLDG